MLDLFLPRFGVKDLPEDAMHDLTLSWHRLDGWPDVATAFPRLGKKFLLAPVSNGNTVLTVGQTWRLHFPDWARSFS
jgi:2-haloacid dehalogenase